MVPDLNDERCWSLSNRVVISVVCYYLVSIACQHVFRVCCACPGARVSTCANFKMDTTSDSELKWGEGIRQDESNSVISTPLIIY